MNKFSIYARFQTRFWHKNLLPTLLSRRTNAQIPPQAGALSRKIIDSHIIALFSRDHRLHDQR